MKLSNKHYNFIKNNVANKIILEKIYFDSSTNYYKILDSETADELRDWAMDLQVKEGFDENYELNPRGQLLEEIIDLLL
ncbi:MAG TPA: hypothetical protein VFR70_02315 [Flavobacterium sp.]|nr:hypothetical protein [Flavobacterium sp.]